MQPFWNRNHPQFSLLDPGPLVLIAVAMAAVLITSSCSPAPSPAATPAPPAQGSPSPAPPTAAPPVVASPTPLPLPTATPAPPPIPTPGVDYRGMRVNELGTIPILEYHIITDEDGRWERSYGKFREDLARLYEAGYRPVSLADLLDNSIDLPAGKSPMVLSFDDSSPGQFRYIDRGGQPAIDPNSAVGMLEEFHAAHPDFALRGVFSVLPEAEQPHKLFGQPEHEARKLRHLVDRGFELANHTYWHQQLDIVDDVEVQKQLALAVKSVEGLVPGYRMDVLTLPLGMWPKNRPLALRGSFEGNRYENRAILLVGFDPAPSPSSKEFDPLALPRVQVYTDERGDSLERWIAYLEEHPEKKYVSDGDPNSVVFPKELEELLNPAALGEKTAKGY